MRTVYFTTSEKETSVGEPDYYVLDSPTSMNDCCLNIDDWPTNAQACSQPEITEFDTHTWDGSMCTKTTTTITDRLVAVILDEEVIVQAGTETTSEGMTVP